MAYKRPTCVPSTLDWWFPKDGFRWDYREGGLQPADILPFLAEEPYAETGGFGWNIGLNHLEFDAPGPWLVPASSHRSAYSLSFYPGLHRKFAGLHIGLGAILDFASKFGWLYGGLIDYRETENLGEPFSFWLMEIRAMHDAQCLWNALREDRHGRLKQMIVWSPHADAVYFRPDRSALVAKTRRELKIDVLSGYLEPLDTLIADDSVRKDSFASFKQFDPVEPARVYLAALISAKLDANVSLGFKCTPDGFANVPTPQNLSGWMWLNLAAEVAGMLFLRQCPMCGSWFARQGKRIYCETRGTGCRKKANRLRDLAKDLMDNGMSEPDVARRLEMSPDTLSSILEGGSRDG